MHADASSTTESPLTVLTHIASSLDALNCAAILVSRNGTIAHANSRFCQTVQRPQEQLAGFDLVELYPPGEAQGLVRDMLEKCEKLCEMEFFLPLPDEHRLPVIFSSRRVGRSPVLSEYSVVTMIDISRQKRAEQALIEQNSRLGELSDLVLEQAKALREYADSLELRVKQRTAELHDSHMETTYILAIASEAKDEDTGQHVRRLKRMSQQLARQMGLSQPEAEQVGISAVLHDVGKIHIPDSILKKPGPLTPEERALMQEHTLVGERILKPSPYFAQASRIARSHHENWDGTGYPDRLAAEAIPFEARLVHLVDVYDALTHPRIYKPAWDHDAAMREILSNRGKMFDPAVVDAFAELVQTGQIERNP
jgi:HD-GYP domain-containing protein (c-di-GMP phosphodiesterase class II)